jgi:hypothetical protein
MQRGEAKALRTAFDALFDLYWAGPLITVLRQALRSLVDQPEPQNRLGPHVLRPRQAERPQCSPTVQCVPVTA